MSWKSLGPRAVSSLSLLDGADPGLLSQQPQHINSRDQEPLNCPERASEPPPSFCSHSPPLAGSKLALWPEVAWVGGAGCSTWKKPPPEDMAGPSSFLPYYRSQEESFPSPGPPGWRRASRDPRPGTEAQAGSICRMTAQDQGHAMSVGSDLLSRAWHSPACSPHPLAQAALFLSSGQETLPATSQALCTSGFTPYYRSPEERLSTSPGPPTSVPGGHRARGKLPLPRAATL